MMHLRCFIAGENSHDLHVFIVWNSSARKFGRVNLFDKFQVPDWVQNMFWQSRNDSEWFLKTSQELLKLPLQAQKRLNYIISPGGFL